ncbi:MAG TPA: pyridoxamine 5'-phosphate oxidase [Acidimicrobiales bacterium]|nr:pyridoxamine 5'-phosphate oxidase [Acidimicrobiales bacterium]
MAGQSLGEEDLDPDPLRQFQHWYAEAHEAGEREPDAMALATAGADGSPTVRFVLLKSVDESGFVFYTNWNSRKGRQLEENPRAALSFRWTLLERQVRIEGAASKMDVASSDLYFATRPRAAQLGAWASAQSEPVASRADLDEHLEVVTARFAGRDVPRPPWWGGYRVQPDRFEFWVSHPDRLHDRFEYRLEGNRWMIRRLNP